VALTVAGAVFAALLGLALHRGTDAALPFWDSTTTSYSLVAQWLQTKKRIETWWFWIAVDVVYIGVYAVKGLWLTALLYGIFLVICLVGLRDWSRSIASGPVPSPEPEAA
jgi:nicotinamide mononucleotide transporter